MSDHQNLNASEVSLRIKTLDAYGPAYGHNQSEAIGFVFRCDMMTAQNIVNRIGAKLGIGTDPIVVLKTADALTICRCALDEIESS